MLSVLIAFLLSLFGITTSVTPTPPDPPEPQDFEVVVRVGETERVLIGTTRKGALVRAIEHSLTNRLLDCCTVPVEVVAGAPAGMIERIGIPAGVGAGVALVWASAS